MNTLEGMLRRALDFPNATRGLREEALREDVIPLIHFESLKQQGFVIKRGCVSSEESVQLVVSFRHPSIPRTHRVVTECKKGGLTETTVFLPNRKALNGSSPSTAEGLRDLIIATAEGILRDN